MRKLLLILFLVTINLQAQYPKHCPSDGQFIAWSTSNSQFSCSIATLPITFGQVTHQFLNSYNSTTGLFTAAQPSFSDLSGIPTLTNIRTGTSSNTDLAGKLTMSAGTGTYTFTGTYSIAPICIIQDDTSFSGLLTKTVSTTTLTVTAGTSDVIDYICIGRN